MAGTEENTNCNAMILLVDTITLYIFQIVESNAHGMTIKKITKSSHLCEVDQKFIYFEVNSYSVNSK